MNAEIHYPGGGLILPLRSAYDWELMLETVGDCAARKGGLSLCMGKYEWRVGRAETASPETCSECQGPLRKVVYRRNRRRLCSRCMKATQ